MTISVLAVQLDNYNFRWSRTSIVMIFADVHFFFIVSMFLLTGGIISSTWDDRTRWNVKDYGRKRKLNANTYNQTQPLHLNQLFLTLSCPHWSDIHFEHHSILNFIINKDSRIYLIKNDIQSHLNLFLKRYWKNALIFEAVSFRVYKVHLHNVSKIVNVYLI